MFVVRLKSVTVNWHTDWSNASSEFKGCEESIDNYVSQSTAMPNMILKYVCGLPVTFPAALIILTSLFLFFSPKLPIQAENFNCNMLLTKLLHLKNSLFFPLVSMAHFVCVWVCVYVWLELRGTPWSSLSFSPLPLISLQLSARKRREGTVSCLQRTMSESDGGTWACT